LCGFGKNNKEIAGSEKCSQNAYCLKRQILLRQASIMTNTKLRGDNFVKYPGYDYGSCALPFRPLPSIYKLSFISIPIVLSKIWPGHIHYDNNKKWLRGNNS